ncbi:MAG: LysE family translocator [Actinomycetota bacterium]|nr:LysE family translocator [Actinomycetota bacterium]
MGVFSTLPAFLFAVTLIWAAPGPAMLLVVRRAALHGARPAMATVLGLGAGLYVWAILAAVGLGALVAASELAYDVLRLAGAGFLVAVGLHALRRAWGERGRAAAEPDALERSGRARQPGNWSGFGEGVLVQLANPKIAVFMLALYPQFVPADAPVLPSTAVLALVQVVVETCLYLPLVACVSRARSWLRRSAIRRCLETASGAVLVGLGVRVAATTR